MFLKVITEGLILGAFLVLFCAVGIRNGAVNMVFLYHRDVQERCISRKMITSDRIKRNQNIFKGIGIPFYLTFILLSVYGINGARGFLPGFLQIFGILSVVNLVDRFFIDEYWVGHTKDWEIPGTEDLKPYIDGRDKLLKWLMGTAGFAILSAILAGIMTLMLRS